jgi:flagellar basal body P-ring formation protein FlgA
MLRLMTLALLFALTAPAAAQVTGSLPPSPKLKELVSVTSDVVRIGDLVDNAGATADIPVFRSPDLGFTGGVPIARVIEALAPYQLATLDTGSLKEVVVTRLSRSIASKEIETRIARTLSSQYGLGDVRNISITFDKDIRTIHVEPSSAEEIQVARLYLDQRTGRFTAMLEVPGSTVARQMPLRFTGTAVETVDAAILTRALNRGEAIKPSDVITERRSKTEAGDDFISADSVVGLAVKRPLRAGSVLHSADLIKAEVVQRNEAVMIVYAVPGVLLTVRGKALEAGAVGDIVNVLNTQSNRTVQATVTGPGRVTIGATIPLQASTTAAATDPSTPPPTSAE